MNIKKIQNYFQEIADLTGVEAGVASQAGTVLACSNESQVGQILNFSEVSEDALFYDGYGYVSLKGDLDLVTFVRSNDKRDASLLLTLAYSVEQLMLESGALGRTAEYYKNLIMGKYGTEQIFANAKECGIEFIQDRRIMIIEVDKHEIAVALEVLGAMFLGNEKVVVAGVHDDSLIVVIDQEEGPEDVAFEIVNVLESDCYISARLGVGTLAATAEELLRSYKTAQTTLMVTGAFEAKKKVAFYDKMGISRLVHGISEQTGLNFIEEVLNDEVYEALGDEYMETINSFFENSLNVSETARKMFIHRNTLVYRLEKIKKITGLDITEFESAAMLKLAMMLRIYLKGDRRKTSD